MTAKPDDQGLQVDKVLANNQVELVKIGKN